MGGRPVWLASYSLRKNGRIVATGKYSQQQRRRAIAALKDLLDGSGDDAAMRVFRMNVTMCLHKALSADEETKIPPEWLTEKGRDIAGGPVEVLEETVEGAPSTRPCVDPPRIVLDRSRPDLWVPGFCGKCAPCIARMEV